MLISIRRAKALVTVMFVALLSVATAHASTSDAGGGGTTTETLAETVRQQQSTIDDLQRRLALLEVRLNQPAPAVAAQSSGAAPVASTAVAATTMTGPTVTPTVAAPGFTPTIKLRGRLNADAWGVDEGANGTEMRRARIGVEGRITERLSYVVEADFAGVAVALQDVIADYSFNDTFRVRTGYHKVPFSLDDQTSENYNLFLEHPVGTNAFVPGRGVGASVLARGDHWYTQAGVYGEAENASRTGVNDENLVIGGRFVYAPILDKSSYLHLGASAYQSRYAGPPSLRLRERPGRHFAPFVVDTQLLDADSMTTVGLEAAYAKGPVGFAAEMVKARVVGIDSQDLNYGGYDVEAWWTLTGEFRPYKLSGGTFDRLIPKRNAGDGGWGAWQMALRRSELDLNDDALNAGEITTNALALNWYWDSHARLMLELDRVEVALPSGSSWQTAVGMRVQVDW